MVCRVCVGCGAVTLAVTRAGISSVDSTHPLDSAWDRTSEQANAVCAPADPKPLSTSSCRYGNQTTCNIYESTHLIAVRKANGRYNYMIIIEHWFNSL